MLRTEDEFSAELKRQEDLLKHYKSQNINCDRLIAETQRKINFLEWALGRRNELEFENTPYMYA